MCWEQEATQAGRVPCGPPAQYMHDVRWVRRLAGLLPSGSPHTAARNMGFPA